MSYLSDRMEKALTKDAIPAFMDGFKAGCEAKADEMQPVLSQLEAQILGLPDDPKAIRVEIHDFCHP